MKSICIATDLHGDTDRALARAARLAHQHGAKLTVVSVMPNTTQDDALAARQKTLAAMVAQQPQATTLETELVVTTGDAVTEVHHAAVRAEADLLVVGPHHQTRILDLLRQTTMEKLACASPTPLLLVAHPVDRDYAKILAPVDFSDACADAVRTARILAPEATVRLLHSVLVPETPIVSAPGIAGDLTTMIDPEPFVEDARATAARWLADHPGLAHLTPPEPSALPLPRVLEHARATHGGDLICLGAHTKRKLLERMLGSFTSEMVRTPPADLLIAPDPKSA